MYPALYGAFVVKRFQRVIFLSCFLDRVSLFDWNPVSSSRPAGFFVRLESRFFIPTRSIAKPARAGAVKVGRRTNLSTRSALARPYLDSSEHGGTLDAVGMTIRGEPAFGRKSSRHNLVFGRSIET
jgi:hypothetical protein